MEVTYRMQNGYQVPNLLMPQTPEVHLGKYAELRREYLMKHRRVLYTNLKTSGKLTEHTATASDFFKCANNLLNFLKALTVIKTIIFNNCFDFTESLIALSFHYLCKWLILLWESDLHLTLGKDVT